MQSEGTRKKGKRKMIQPRIELKILKCEKEQKKQGRMPVMIAAMMDILYCGK